MKQKPNDNKAEMANVLKYLGPKVITDKKELDKVKPYLELIQGCVENENISNIAVTGTYGSGKSTVLKTFQDWYKPYRKKKGENYLNISLASFDMKNIKGKDKELLNFEKRVELSILQQMFYQVESNILPGSRFKRIVNIKHQKLYTFIVFVILWLISFSVLFNFDFLKRTPLKWLIENPTSWWNIIPWVVMLFGIGLIIKKTFFLFNNSRIHKVNIKGEMELGDMGESVFNQYLEEILYFFERTKYKVVIIEDIDRFGDTQLFTKLREVNILLNSSKVIERPIKFIYAVKDDMFKNRTERTKFFDFIVPIIPFVNPHNASEQLKSLVQNNDIQLSEEFLEDITSFIGDIDMRLIINVFNEFNLYRKKISAGNLDRLMAIVFYKNLYPKDFANLHQDQGKLFDLLSKKDDYKESINEEIEGEKEEIDDKIKAINKEQIKNVQELRKIYLFTLLLKLQDVFKFDMGFEQIEDAVLDENFTSLYTKNKIQYVTRSYNTNYRRWDESSKSEEGVFQKVEKEISDLSYIEREESIKSKTNGELEKLKKEKLSLSEKQNKVNLLNFSELFQKAGTEKNFADFEKDLKNPKEVHLIRYLVLRGYIGDDYRDYISLFFDVSITREDYDFIQNIKLGNLTSFEFQPSNPKKIINKIPDRYFSQPQTLNYDLFSYCLRNKGSELTKLKLYLDILSLNEERNLRFIMDFTKHRDNEIPMLISQLSGVKTNLWAQLKDANLPEDELKKWVVYIFDFANDVEDILKFEALESLMEYLAEQNLFELARLMKNDNHLKDFLLNKKVKINKLDEATEKQDELFQSIYQNNLFKLNSHNIIKIVKHLSPEINIEDLKTSNYTVLREMSLEPLLRIVNDDIENYIGNVLLSENNKKESEETVLEILNNENIEQKTKKEFILHQKTDITDLSKVQNLQVKRIVLDLEKVNPNWLNIFDYYQLAEEDFDETIVGFLNIENNYIELSKLKIKSLETEEDNTKTFIAKLIRSNKIGNQAYSKLLNSLPHSYTFFGLSSVEEDKVEILIKKKILLFTKKNYDDIWSSNPDLTLLFLEANQEKTDFIKKTTEFEIDDDMIIDILKSGVIYNHHKIEFVKGIDESRIISNSKLAKGILEWWLPNSNLEFEFDVLEALFKINQEPDKKVLMLLMSFKKLDKSQIKTLTELIGEEYKKLFIPHQKPEFKKSDKVLELLKKLYNEGLISSVKEGKKLIKPYPFNKNKED